MGEPRKHYVKGKKPVMKEHIRFYLYEMPGIGQYTETESDVVVAQDGGNED